MKKNHNVFKLIFVLMTAMLMLIAFAMVSLAATDVETQIAGIKTDLDHLEQIAYGNSADIAAVDAEVSEISAAIAALENDMLQYATKSEVNAQISALRAELTDTLKAYVDKKIKELNDDVQNNSADIAAVSARVTEMNKVIEALSANMSQYVTESSVKAEITALRAELTDTLKAYVDEELKDLRWDVNYNTADIAAINSKVKETKQLIEALAANMSEYATASAVQTEISTLRAELTDTLKAYVDEKLEDLKWDVNYNTADIAAIRAKVTNITQMIEAISADMSEYATTSAVQTEISTLRAELTDTLKGYIDQKIKDLKGFVDDNTTGVAALETKVKQTKQLIEALAANMSEYATASAVQTEISTLRAELTDTLKGYVDQKIKDLNKFVDNNKTDIAAVKAKVDAINAAISVLESNLSEYATNEEMNTALSGLRTDVTSTLKGYVDQKIKDLYQNSTGDLDIAVIVYRIDTLEEAIKLLEDSLPSYATNEELSTEIAALRVELRGLIEQEISKLTERVRKNEESIKKLNESNDSKNTLAIVGIVVGGIGLASSVTLGIIVILDKKTAKR